MEINGLKSTIDFVNAIEDLVKKKNVEYFEAVLLYCEKNNVEIETIAQVVKQNSALKSKIQIEAENLNMVKRSTARLPI